MRKILFTISALAAFIASPIPHAQAAYEMQLNSLSPPSGIAGATVRLIGTNFGASQAGHRVVISHNATHALRNMTVTSWSNTQIVAVVPSDVMSGASSIAILNPTGEAGVVNASRHAPYTVMPTLKPGIAQGIGKQGFGKHTIPGKGPQLQIRPAGCPDPAVVELKPGWPRRNADGTYTFHVLAIMKNVGTATFDSQRRQTQITLREGSRVLKSGTWSSPRATTVVLEPGQGFSENHVVERWSPSSEFLADFSAEISYDPDIRMDGNPQNDDCGAGNNRKTLSVAELRRLLSTVR